MTSSRHATPILVPASGELRPLTQLHLGKTDLDGRRREAFIQDLVFQHPEIIPINEIEPAFHPLVPVCRELKTSDGLYVDNLWISPWGGIVLGECKLVRNPEARREVVVQALDYARALHGWNFDVLEAAIREARAEPNFSLWDLIKDKTDLDEGQFIDTINRKLRFGRVLLLIIGDGIQENVEALTEYLQLHAGLHVAMSLVDLSIWHGASEGLIVVPRIPMRTVLLERGIVIVDAGSSVRIDPPTTQPASSMLNRRTTPSEGEFMDQLEERRPGVAARLKPFLQGLVEIGVTPEFRKSIILRWFPSPDVKASFGYIEASGRVWLGDGYGTGQTHAREGYPDAGERYLQAIANAIGGQIRRYEKASPQVVDANGRPPDILTLLDRSDTWLDAIRRLASETRPSEQ